MGRSAHFFPRGIYLAVNLKPIASMCFRQADRQLKGR